VARLARDDNRRARSVPNPRTRSDTPDALSAVVASLEPAIAADAAELTWEHADPSDRIIVATARRLGAAVVTADTAILDFAAATRAVRRLEI